MSGAGRLLRGLRRAVHVVEVLADVGRFVPARAPASVPTRAGGCQGTAWGGGRGGAHVHARVRVLNVRHLTRAPALSCAPARAGDERGGLTFS